MRRYHTPALLILLIGILNFPLKGQILSTRAFQEYLRPLAGTWVGQPVSGLAEEDELFWIEIDLSKVEGNRIGIIISEYCTPGMAKHLNFEWIDNRLVYVDAFDGYRNWPLMYLDFAEIEYQVEAGEIILYYESSECEMQNHLNIRLRKIHEATFNPTSLL